VIGGVESHVEDLLRGLGERDHDVLMVCGRGGQAAAEQGWRVITLAAVAGADLFSDRPLDQSSLLEAYKALCAVVFLCNSCVMVHRKRQILREKRRLVD
jgi:hypothetical protein